jgi:heme-degrading monooxygenase HmoA
MENLANETGPLTVVVTWRVRKGREKEFEAWRHEIASAALQFPGHMGVNVILPNDTEREYVVIFRFDTYEHLCAWQDSDIRRELLKKAEPFRETPPSYRLESGLEYWFTPPGVPDIPSTLGNGSCHRRGCLASQYVGAVAVDPSYTWTAFSLAGTPGGCRHSNSAHVGDHAVTGKNSETLAVISYKGGNRI